MNTPLHGKRILVTRPASQAGKLAQMIVAQGGIPVRFPLLEIAPAADPLPLQQVIARLEIYGIAVFISPNAVEFSVPLILSTRPWPATVQAAAIGQSTAEQLALCGIGRVIAPTERFDSEALLELAELQSDRVAGNKVVILRGNGGRDLLAATLIERGAEVHAVTCYHRSAPSDGKLIVSLLRNRQLDALTISSSEGLRNLRALLDTDAFDLVQTLPVFVPHQRIAEVAVELGLQRVRLSRPTDAGIIDSLCEFNWLDHE